MEIIKKEVNGKVYEFINSSRGNRSGFVHETQLFKDGRLLGKNKVQYYNRTWECYRYQSVMRGVIYKLLESYKEDFKTIWKNRHNVKRLTETKKQAMMEDLESNLSYAELKELYSLL